MSNIINVFAQMGKERAEAMQRNTTFAWDLEIVEADNKRLKAENSILKDLIKERNRRVDWLKSTIEKLKAENTGKQNNSLVTDDTAAIVEAYEQLATAYGMAETLAKLYAVREAGKPVELTVSEIAYKIDTAIKLLKDEE